MMNCCQVRKFCLQYGASLFYTSVKEDKNCDLLYKYLVHKNYNFSFTTPALVVERDAVFIPAGRRTHLGSLLSELTFSKKGIDEMPQRREFWEEETRLEDW